MKGDDIDAIEAKTKVLVEASGKIAERAYQQSGGQGQGPTGGAAGGEGADATGGESGASEDVVDAEFEEVKDDK